MYKPNYVKVLEKNKVYNSFGQKGGVKYVSECTNTFDFGGHLHPLFVSHSEVLKNMFQRDSELLMSSVLPECNKKGVTHKGYLLEAELPTLLE